MRVVTGTRRIALIGNPNTGKTTLFNALTGLSQRVGNYPGVTVERKIGRMQLGDLDIDVLDLPGTYSLAARSPDEAIAIEVLLGHVEGTGDIDAILAIVDASNLERNLYLVSQLVELGLPLVVCLNMVDVATGRGISVDTEQVAARLGAPIVAIQANRKVGVDRLREELLQVLEQDEPQHTRPPTFPPEMEQELQLLDAAVREHLGRPVSRPELIRALVDDGGILEERLRELVGPKILPHLKEARTRFAEGQALHAIEARTRYGWVRGLLLDAVERPLAPPVTTSDRLDRVLTHKLGGTLVFALVMGVVFQSIYSWAGPLMDVIDGIFGWAGGLAAGVLPSGALQSLLVDGIIGGVGAVVIFLPQIVILFLFIAILEDCGYMARAAFLMDRLLAKVGLTGKSFIPLLSSFACAIPGIMATRTIESRRVRLTTILVAPLMSCSARLPVYVLLIAAFIPSTTVLGGLIGLQGLTLFAMYLLGIAVAIPVAWLLGKTVLQGEPAPFLMELPSYKVPSLRTVLLRVYDRGWAFLKRAGTIIFAVTVVVWALGYFPQSEELKEQHQQTVQQVEKDHEESIAALLEGAEAPDRTADLQAVVASGKLSPEQAEQLESMWLEQEAHLASLEQEHAGNHLRQSILGQMGQAVEPAVKPLGWDWRIGMAAIASFPAREVVVATLGTIFNLGDEQDEESTDLRTALKSATTPSGALLFGIPVALSLMVFFALCCQCGATLAIIKRETASWGWPIFTFLYMTGLAYVGALITYHGAVALGWG